jgi:hypothetical protein
MTFFGSHRLDPRIPQGYGRIKDVAEVLARVTVVCGISRTHNEGAIPHIAMAYA